jgi:hypothetical protein
MNTILRILLASLFFSACPFIVSNSYAQSDARSCDYVIAGVYYLMVKTDPNQAEQEFQKAILVSSFESLSKDSKAQSSERYYVAEAYYFLGKIHYDRAISQGNITQNIGKAKMYLLTSEKYGMIYDRLHPKLLDKIEQNYPNVPAETPRLTNHKAKATFEIDNESYQIDAIKISSDLSVSKDKFRTNRELELEAGTKYKLEPNFGESHKSIYRALITVGIGVVICIARN